MIEPVKKTVFAACGPHEAFDIFTARIDAWWPKHSHSIVASRSGGAPRSVVFEARPGGRIYEVCEDGTTHDWGQVIEAERGRKLLFSWHVGRPADEASEVEIRFEDAGDKGTRVSLEHRNWDRFGAEAQATRDGYDSGWDFVLGECYLSATVRETA